MSKKKRLFGILLALPPLLLGLLYGGGYIAQFMRNYHEWEAAGGTPGNGTSPTVPSFAVSECLRAIFTMPYGIVGILICVGALVLLIVTGYMTHRSAAECMQRLVRRGLVAEGEGELGADALFNLLSGLYVVPISESPILRLISFIRLTVFEHIPYAVTKQIFRRDKRSSDEQKVMLLANQAMLSTAEMIKCAELNTFAFDSEDELIDTLYHDEYTTSENIAHSVRFLPQCRPVITSVANLYLRKQIIFERM